MLRGVYGIPAAEFANYPMARHENRGLLDHMMKCFESTAPHKQPVSVSPICAGCFRTTAIS